MTNHPWLRRGAGAAVTLVLVLVVAAFVVQAAPGVVGAEESYVVLSGSMEPAISPGDAVVVQDVPPEKIEVGDVVTFRRSGESDPVTHRVVEVVERDGRLAFRTKGDANEDPDTTLVPASAVVGRVWFTMPLVGHVVLFANTTLGRAVLVGVPLAAFVASELYAFATGGADDDSNGDGDAAGELDGDPLTTTTGTLDDDDSAAQTDGEHSGATADGEFAVSTTDLRLSSLGFGSLAAYSGYVAATDTSPVSVAIFAGAFVVLLFVAAVYALGDPEPPAPASARADGGGPESGGDDGGS